MRCIFLMHYMIKKRRTENSHLLITTSFLSLVFSSRCRPKIQSSKMG
jgi:hypothetical protein